MTNTAVIQAIRALPLKEMDALMLAEALHAEAKILWTDAEYRMVADSITLATYLHRNQTRANRGDMPRTHYIEHPLRGGNRLIRLGNKNAELCAGIILHDGVEDGLDDLVALSGNGPVTSVVAGRMYAFEYLQENFGYTTTHVVRGLTNRLYPEGTTKEQKRGLYAADVTEEIEDVLVAVGKVIDFIENAGGLKHNNTYENRGMVQHLARKYSPLVDVFIDRVSRDDFREQVSEEGHDRLLEQLKRTGSSLMSIQMLR